jgi:hypothetical protein
VSSAKWVPTLQREIIVSSWTLNLGGLGTVTNSVVVFWQVRHEAQSSQPVATRYGLEGLEIEFRRGCDFSYTSRPVQCPTHSPVMEVPGVLPRGKADWPWRGFGHSPQIGSRG